MWLILNTGQTLNMDRNDCYQVDGKDVLYWSEGDDGGYSLREKFDSTEQAQERKNQIDIIVNARKGL